MPDLTRLKAFNVAEAAALLWIFKKSYPNSGIKFTGRWVDITDDLTKVLRATLTSELERVEELLDFGLLTQNNEQSLLTIDTVSTHGDQIPIEAAEETDQKRIKIVKHVENAEIYVAKFVFGDDVLFAVKRTDNSWKTRKKAGLTNITFSDQKLDINTDPSFNISDYFDFLIWNDDIYIRSKGAFETVLSYKQAHLDDFDTLCQDDDFIEVFTDLESVRNYVETSKTQLRRASAIKEKGHYKDSAFLQNLRNKHADYGLEINFDDNGKIIPDEATCPHIFIALLDHRLSSAFSENIYDVQDTAEVQM